MTGQATPLHGVVFLLFALTTSAYEQGVCPSNVAEQVTNTYGSCGCDAPRPDGAPCPYHTKEHPYGSGSCYDGIWCEYFQSKCLNGKCGAPAETLCISAGGVKCGGGAPYCYNNGTHKLCLSHDRGVCLGKEYGTTCTTNKGEKSLCLDSSYDAGYLRRSVDCGDKNCYACAHPTSSACYGRTELQGCNDYEQLYSDQRTAKAVYAYKGGQCQQKTKYGVNYLKCVGASRQVTQASSGVQGLPAAFVFMTFAAVNV